MWRPETGAHQEVRLCMNGVYPVACYIVWKMASSPRSPMACPHCSGDSVTFWSIAIPLGMGLWYFAIHHLSFLLRDDTFALAQRIYLMSCYWVNFFCVEIFGSLLRWPPTAQSYFQTLVRAYSLRPNLDFLPFDSCPKTAFEVCRKEWPSRGDTEPSWIRGSSHGERKFLEDHSIIKVWKPELKRKRWNTLGGVAEWGILCWLQHYRHLGELLSNTQRRLLGGLSKLHRRSLNISSKTLASIL